MMANLIWLLHLILNTCLKNQETCNKNIKLTVTIPKTQAKYLFKKKLCQRGHQLASIPQCSHLVSMLDPLQCPTIRVVCLLLNACVRHSTLTKSPIITIRSVRIRRLLRNSSLLMISLSHSIIKTQLKLI